MNKWPEGQQDPKKGAKARKDLTTFTAVWLNSSYVPNLFQKMLRKEYADNWIRNKLCIFIALCQ